MFPMGGAKCCTLLSAVVWFPLSPWDEGSCSAAGLGHGWAQQCWQVPLGLFAQVTPPPHAALLQKGGGSTSEGTFSPSLSPPWSPGLMLCPALSGRACWQRGLSRSPGPAGLPCGSAALLGAAHPTARCHLPCLLLSLCQCKGGISVQKQILQHLIHPLHWCERGGDLVLLHLRVACQEPRGVVRSLRTRCHCAGWGLTLPPPCKLGQLFYLSCF